MRVGLMTSQDDALLDALPSVMPTQVIQIMYVSIPVLMDSSPLKYSRLVWLSALMTPSPATIQRNVWFYVPMVNTPMPITKYAWTNATSTTANSQITPPTCASNNVPPNPTCSPRRAPMNASCFVRLGSSPTQITEHALLTAHNPTSLILHQGLVCWSALSTKGPSPTKSSGNAPLPAPTTPSMGHRLSIMLIHPPVGVSPCAHKNHRNSMATTKPIPAKQPVQLALWETTIQGYACSHAFSKIPNSHGLIIWITFV